MNLNEWFYRHWNKYKSKKRIQGRFKLNLSLKKDPEDNRDYRASITAPNSYYIITMKPFTKVKHQGMIGSCVSHAFCSAYEIMMRMRGFNDIELSELFHYYIGRALAGSLPKDSGMYLRDGAKAFQKIGVSLEGFWPYDYRKYNEGPIKTAYNCAGFYKIKEYFRLNGTQNIKDIVGKYCPVVFSIPIYQNFIDFKDTKTGLLPKPVGRRLGSHAMVIIGFNDELQAFEVLNSWGTKWGQKGYCYLPYDYPIQDAWSFK